MLPLSLSAALAAPVFDVDRGVHDAAFTLNISPSVAGAAVSFSVDRGAPTVPYTGALTISGTTVVRAMEVAPDGTESETVTYTYLFIPDVVSSSVMDPNIVTHATYGPILDATLRALPTVSLVVPAGISTTEQPASFEWIDPDADDLQVDCGVAVTGTSSLGYPKNSLRLYFRSEYGPSNVEFDFWSPDGIAASEEQDALSLRSGHDSVFYLGAQGQYLRNYWMDSSQLAMGHLAPHGNFAHVYVNGTYHGLYHVRERFNAAFGANYLGGSEDDYEMVNGGTVISGDGTGWGAVLAHQSDYAGVQEWLNVPDFLDYMVLNYYAGNAWDWSAYHNWVAVGSSEPGGGGFRFESSDSDICIYYDYTVDITANTGPSYVFGYLLQEADPDFLVALEDAIFRNLRPGAPLSAEAAGARYARLAALAEEGVVAESARWGSGWWDRDDEWVTERDRLLNQYFPYRTDEVLRQFRAVGWYPLDGPELSIEGGLVAAGTSVTVSSPGAEDLWVTTDGRDPRETGEGPDVVRTLTIDRSTVVKARLRAGDTWGPLAEAFYEVDEAPPIVLNEWNAVAPGRTLDEDAALGVVDGNGGDWIELLVLADGLDLRGWTLTMEDRRGPAGALSFSDDPMLASLRAGTILTIAEDLPEDATLDPDRGDWRFHLRASTRGSGRYVSAADFDVTALDWQLTLSDADGHPRFGPAGEGVEPRGGISSSEVGLLGADPSAALRRDSPGYRDGARSTFGAANVWDDGAQDLSVLRGQSGGVVELDSGEPASGEPGQTGCGCDAGMGRGALAVLLAAAFVARRRGLWLLALAGCEGTAITTTPPGDSDSGATDACEPEVCDGIDNDCDGAVDEDPVDPLPFYGDADADGYGDEDVVVLACTAGDGAAMTGGDCDDADDTIHPGAAEVCDGVDRDCDGASGASAGVSAACGAPSCLAILEAGVAADGPRWLALPSGEAAEVWCDMTTDGGGWTLGFLRNTASTGSQGGFGGDDTSLGALAVSPEEASASATARLGWTDLEALSWSELALGAYSGGARTYASRSIPRTDLRIAFGEDGYLLYGEGGYYWCGGDASYTDAGVGAVNNPEGAPPDCKYHGSLGSGWDFSESPSANAGLTLCGGDGSYFLSATWGGTYSYYGAAGAAQAIWVR